MGRGDAEMLSRYLEDINENFKNKYLTHSSPSSFSLLQTLESHVSSFSYSPPKISSPIKTSPKKSIEQEMSLPSTKNPKVVNEPEGGVVGRSEAEAAGKAAMADGGVLFPKEVDDLSRRASKEVTDRILARKASRKQGAEGAVVKPQVALPAEKSSELEAAQGGRSARGDLHREGAGGERVEGAAERAHAADRRSARGKARPQRESLLKVTRVPLLRLSLP